MALDEALMNAAPELPGPVLRFYGWSEPAATFGYFQKYSEVAGWTPLRPLIRRPTGGGLVPHDADWTYSVVIPAGHEWYEALATESYRRIHSWVQAALDRCKVATSLAPGPIPEGVGQCFIGAEQFDLLAGGRKIAGAAQRRSKTGLLIQGSVQPTPRNVQRGAWEAAMLAVGPQFGADAFQNLELPSTLVAAAEQLVREKYSQESFNQRR